MGDSGCGSIDTETLITAAKWTVTILIMGFITQFGRKLASYLMGKAATVRKGTKSPTGTRETPPTPGDPATADRAREKAHYKLEKKAAKAREKAEKKKGKD